MRLYLKAHMLCVLLLAISAIMAAQTVTFSIHPSSLKPGKKGKLKATLIIPKGKYQSHSVDDFFTLTAEHPSLQFGELKFPRTRRRDAYGALMYEDSVTLTLPFRVLDSAMPGPIIVKCLLTHCLCIERGPCLPPEDVEGTVILDIK